MSQSNTSSMTLLPNEQNGHPALEVACPACGVPSGRPCIHRRRQIYGWMELEAQRLWLKIKRPHRERIDAARTAR